MLGVWGFIYSSALRKGNMEDSSANLGFSLLPCQREHCSPKPGVHLVLNAMPSYVPLSALLAGFLAALRERCLLPVEKGGL